MHDFSCILLYYCGRVRSAGSCEFCKRGSRGRKGGEILCTFSRGGSVGPSMAAALLTIDHVCTQREAPPQCLGDTQELVRPRFGSQARIGCAKHRMKKPPIALATNPLFPCEYAAICRCYQKCGRLQNAPKLQLQTRQEILLLPVPIASSQ
jgi:hypothetical protein